MAQIDKNNVPAANQLQNARVFFHRPENTGLRVLFAGNSITLHGPAPQIGWTGNWGMAASTEKKDYVHLLEAKILAARPEATFCVCQVADWERSYKNPEEVLAQYQAAREFGADVIVARFIENVPTLDFDPVLFRKNYEKFLEFLNPKGGNLILTDGFWKHPGDGQIHAAAEKPGLILVTLGDLGEREDMKAIGLFEHEGVANHPGDLGMAVIAERIWDALKIMVS